MAPNVSHYRVEHFQNGTSRTAGVRMDTGQRILSRGGCTVKTLTSARLSLLARTSASTRPARSDASAAKDGACL